MSGLYDNPFADDDAPSAPSQHDDVFAGFGGMGQQDHVGVDVTVATGYQYSVDHEDVVPHGVSYPQFSTSASSAKAVAPAYEEFSSYSQAESGAGGDAVAAVVHGGWKMPLIT